jgi:prevent-host-death family protein
MKTVSIEELKRRLSSSIARAAAGERLVITKHGRPVAALGPVGLEHVHVGDRVGRAHLTPLFRAATHGEYLTVLLEDRRHDRFEHLVTDRRRDRRR